MDVYRGTTRAQTNPVNAAVYISFFPQLLAGPIVRYKDIAAQITGRTESVEKFSLGAKRFTMGLAKKVLIANTLGQTVDQIFAIPALQLTTGLSWLGAVSYALQIYFYFSGYSDMAIGLAKMFGFEFLENFNYPYVSKSITEFWRRWHISLSTWFRDYVYIPLGGNRRGPWRVYLNLLIVFFLCGLWHGANWKFVIWGLFHGAFLVLERLYGERFKQWWRPLRHGYALLILIVGWVLFRADTLGYAAEYLKTMFGLSKVLGAHDSLRGYLSLNLVIALAAAIAGSMPLVPFFEKIRAGRAGVAVTAGEFIFLGFFLFASFAALATGTYNPFIYFRF